MDPSDRRVGTTIRDKWTLERLLGKGGMAAVYVARHRIGRLEAIKILHPDIARSPSIRERFEREARAVNAFRHPAIVEVRDVDVTESGEPFLVMELVEGETLYARWRREGTISEDELLRIADELLDALAAAHERGIVHRDIKPDNLVIEPDGRLKVLDFGIARFHDPGLDTGDPTRSGVLLGTAGYMAPEQARGLPIDGRADVFAVGAVLFRILSGRRIHEAEAEGDLLVKGATEPAPPLASVAPSVSPGLAAVVDRALALHRERRYPDARTMQEDVRALRRGEPPPYATAPDVAGASTVRDGAGGEPSTVSVPKPAAWEAREPTLASPSPGLGEPARTPEPREDSSAAPPAAPPSVLRQVGRWALLVLSGGLFWLSVLFMLLLMGPDEKKHSLFTTVVTWIVAALPMVAAFFLFRVARRLAPPSAKAADDAMRAVLRLARQHGGELTVGGVVADSTLTWSEASDAVSRLERLGTCRTRSDPAGHTVYEFPEFKRR